MRTGTFAWDDLFPRPAFRDEALRGIVRLAAVVAFLAFFGYCASVAWGVLGHLGAVKLSDCRHVLDVMTVRDAVLCLLGYRLGLELLRAVMRRAPR